MSGKTRIRAVVMQAEMDHLDDDGKVTASVKSDLVPMFEAEIIPELRAFLAKRGIEEKEG